jgi:hypothetical protein
MGRPSKLNEQLIKDMSAEIAEGTPVQYVCDYFGITHMTDVNCMQQGEIDYNAEVDTLYASYFAAIKKAQAKYVMESRKKIQAGGSGWQGSAWWLERTRQDFMPKQQIQADDDGKVTVVIGGKAKPTNK